MRWTALGFLLVLLLPASALADVGLDVKRISGETPFPNGCGVVGEQTKDSEAEPHIEVDPRDPKRIVVTWQQDRFAIDGGALTNLVSVSEDGGETFEVVQLPGISRCTGGEDERTSDPWLSFGPAGELYMASLTFTETPPFSTFELAGPTALRVQRSDDGGRSFGQPVTVVDRALYDDREAVTADPTRPNTAYMAWVLRYGSMGESGFEFFSKTIDGGRTWTEPRTIYTPPSGFFPDPTIIEVLPDGTLLNFFNLLNGSEQAGFPDDAVVPWRAMVSRSTDAGETWSEAMAIGEMQPYPPQDPDTGRQVRAFPVISTAVAPDGTAYVAWNERPGSAVYDASTVWLARSQDKGVTWSLTKVAEPRGQSFLPTLAVAGDGTVGVLFDDTRHDVKGDLKFLADVWLRTSGDRGRTWSERHVAGPFDLLTAPATGSAGVKGIFVGDYQGMHGLPHGFAATFSVSGPLAQKGPSDTFFMRARLASVVKPLALRVSARPKRLRARRRTTVTVRVTAAGRAIKGALVKLAGRSRRTDRAGRARLKVRPRRAGRLRVTASLSGYRSARLTLRVR